MDVKLYISLICAVLCCTHVICCVFCLGGERLDTSQHLCLALTWTKTEFQRSSLVGPRERWGHITLCLFIRIAGMAQLLFVMQQTNCVPGYSHDSKATAMEPFLDSYFEVFFSNLLCTSSLTSAPTVGLIDPSSFIHYEPIAFYPQHMTVSDTVICACTLKLLECDFLDLVLIACLLGFGCPAQCASLSNRWFIDEV